MNGFEADTYFAMKAYLKYKAMVFLTFAFTFTIFYFGLMVRLFERPLGAEGLPGRYHYNHIWNAFWNVFVSMSTSNLNASPAFYLQ